MLRLTEHVAPGIPAGRSRSPSTGSGQASSFAFTQRVHPCGSFQPFGAWAAGTPPHRHAGMRALLTLLTYPFFPQQFLNFLPLLQGQGSLRPTFGPLRTGLALASASLASLTISLPAFSPAGPGAPVLPVLVVLPKVDD